MALASASYLLCEYKCWWPLCVLVCVFLCVCVCVCVCTGVCVILVGGEGGQPRVHCKVGCEFVSVGRAGNPHAFEGLSGRASS